MHGRLRIRNPQQTTSATSSGNRT